MSRPVELSDDRWASALLGVPAGADDRSVVQAYRSYVREHHPDAGGTIADLGDAAHARDLLLDRHLRGDASASRRTFHRRVPWWHRLIFWRSA